MPTAFAHSVPSHTLRALLSTYLTSLRMCRKIKNLFCLTFMDLTSFFYLSEYIETIMSNNLIYYLTIISLIWSILILGHECSPVTLLLTICNAKILFYYTGKQRWKLPLILDLKIIFHI